MHTPTRVSLCLRGSRKAPKDMEVMHSTGSTTLKMLEKAIRLAWKAKLSWAVRNNNNNRCVSGREAGRGSSVVSIISYLVPRCVPCRHGIQQALHSVCGVKVKLAASGVLND